MTVSTPREDRAHTSALDTAARLERPERSCPDRRRSTQGRERDAAAE